MSTVRPGGVTLAHVRRSCLLVACLVSLVMGCGGPGAAHYEAVIDGLALPDEWELARTVIYAPDGDVKCDPSPFTDCPYAIRYFVTAEAPAEAYQAALVAVRGAGLEVSQEFDPSCNPQSQVPCGFAANRGADQMNVAI